MENAEEVLNDFRGHFVTKAQQTGRDFTVSFPLDYDGLDAFYSMDVQSDYERVLNRVNRRFPQDSANTNRWVIQMFDTLIEYTTTSTPPFTSYSYANTAVHIDSIQFLYGHINNSGM